MCIIACLKSSCEKKKNPIDLMILLLLTITLDVLQLLFKGRKK